jgi:hypothetical protein
MKRILRPAIAAVGLAASLLAQATTSLTDFSDLWYNAPAESEAGWGVNVAQQGDILFATLFVYGADRKPHWYVASNVGATGASTFAGPLFDIASGTWFGAPWAGITPPQAVGDIAFAFDSSSHGTLTYTVNGVQVTKGIVRQSWRSDVLSGLYVGAVSGFGQACGPTGRVRIPGALNVTHAPPAITMTLDFAVSPSQTGRCTYHGTYAQVGSLGRIDAGSYSCDVNGVVNAVVGNFTVDEIRATRSGFNGRITVVSPNCDYAGYLGGVKDQF